MSEMENLSVSQALDLLLEKAEVLPTQALEVERLSIKMTIQAFHASTVDRIKAECIRKVGRGRSEREEFDDEEFKALLVTRATTALSIGGVDIPKCWENQELLAKRKASSGAVIVRKVFLGGELDAISDQVLKISGYYLNLDDVKN